MTPTTRDVPRATDGMTVNGESRVVVVGAGLAGTHTVKTLRRNGFNGPLTLVGAEVDAPYDRTKLSKEYLQGRIPRNELALQRADWYAEQGVSLRLGASVDRVDRAARTVGLASGEHLPYDRLVLATGAAPRLIPIPGVHLPGVLTLRTLRDADGLHALLRPGRRLAVVGAGWLGLEVAASARQAGMEVTVLARESQPLAGILGDRLGRHIARVHRRHGVDLRMTTRVTGILEQDGRAAGVRTDDGDVEADAVLLAVGARPDSGLAEAAGLEMADGVMVDARMQTSDPNIFAVGDIADAWNTRLGRRLRREHWDNARRQGALAARAILGLEGAYDWVPYFYTDQFEFGMEYVGDSGREDETVIRGSMDDGEFIVFWLRDGYVTAAMNVNVWDVSDRLRDLVGQRVLPENLENREVTLVELRRP